MSNPILPTTNSKLDTRVKGPSGVVPPTSGPGSPDRFSCLSTFRFINSYFFIYKQKMIFL